MRHIEFRARWKDNLKPVEDFDNHPIYELNEDFIVEQFTGLTDKNGVKIFEGDIYTHGDMNILYVVVWHDTGFIGKQIGSSSYAGLKHWLDCTEVIGNIHDNPELLEAI